MPDQKEPSEIAQMSDDSSGFNVLRWRETLSLPYWILKGKKKKAAPLPPSLENKTKIQLNKTLHRKSENGDTRVLNNCILYTVLPNDKEKKKRGGCIREREEGKMTATYCSSDQAV